MTDFTEERKAISRRLSRIEGQVKGLNYDFPQRTYCIPTQVSLSMTPNTYICGPLGQHIQNAQIF